MPDRLPNIRAKLPDRGKLLGQIPRIGPCHVASDPLGSFLVTKDVIEDTPEATPALDLGLHLSTPIREPRTMANTRKHSAI